MVVLGKTIQIVTLGTLKRYFPVQVTLNEVFSKSYLLPLLVVLCSNFFCSFQHCFAQTDSTLHFTQIQESPSFQKLILRKELIAPSALIAFGLVSVDNPYIINQNEFLKNELQENIQSKFHLDDYSQYASTAAFLGFEYLGIKPQHTFKQRLFTGAVSHAIMAGVVNVMKATIPILRPDGSAFNSFPSGHTATAFVGAELLWQEYHHQSIWYGIAGYTIAAGTGFCRMYNNKHWLTDVAMGAGIGILSTKIAYWMLPWIEKKPKILSENFVLVPGYNGNQVTCALVGRL